MPEISRFLGIIITMYWEVDAPHSVPHFHVRYNEYKASYGIDPIVQLAGALPRRQQRLVEAWAEIYQTELMAGWEQLQKGQKPLPIKGLV
jgi:hypothetical protein